MLERKVGCCLYLNICIECFQILNKFRIKEMKNLFYNHQLHCATNFRLKKSRSHIRPVLVKEKYPDSNSDLYFPRLGTFFMYYKSYFIGYE